MLDVGMYLLGVMTTSCKSLSASSGFYRPCPVNTTKLLRLVSSVPSRDATSLDLLPF